MDNVPGTNELQPDDVDLLQVAAALASALDADDFESVAEMLGDDVEYRIGDVVHQGPDAVVASYRNGSASARRIFEQVEYSHEIIGLVGEHTVRIDYADDLSADGEHIEHHRAHPDVVDPAVVVIPNRIDRRGTDQAAKLRP